MAGQVKTFKVTRNERVMLHGCVFPSGTTAVEWGPPSIKHSSLWDSFDIFKRVHVDLYDDDDDAVEVVWDG